MSYISVFCISTSNLWHFTRKTWQYLDLLRSFPQMAPDQPLKDKYWSISPHKIAQKTEERINWSYNNCLRRLLTEAIWRDNDNLEKSKIKCQRYFRVSLDAFCCKSISGLVFHLYIWFCLFIIHPMATKVPIYWISPYSSYLMKQKCQCDSMFAFLV